MEIKHDKEIFNDLIDDLKAQHEGLDNLKNKVELLFDLILPLNIASSRSVLFNAINNLEDSLICDFAEELEEFIERLDEINVTFEDEDIKMKNSIEGK